jgi:multidrug efflux pump subunit AcrA (membrane-fusion protein)
VIRIPLRALRFQPAAATAGVWLAEDGDALRRVEIQTGLRDERHAELVAGPLAPGDLVVVGLEKPSGKPQPTSPFGVPRIR